MLNHTFRNCTVDSLPWLLHPAEAPNPLTFPCKYSFNEPVSCTRTKHSSDQGMFWSIKTPVGRKRAPSSVHIMSAKNVNVPLLSVTKLHHVYVSQHLWATIPARVWIGMEEHLIHSNAGVSEATIFTDHFCAA
ncbi:hypothetical protein AVEN_17918-1 [Araneus ventricosus]|uniref:Uncharacterized protein n=1 Tax=Araneus ventricosus TaxID=182803 RepID=A0A4Y2G1M8_ARAVE|nr:hypothetical protein AVEN_17918-1 [Araneus ventricosus]